MRARRDAAVGAARSARDGSLLAADMPPQRSNIDYSRFDQIADDDSDDDEAAKVRQQLLHMTSDDGGSPHPPGVLFSSSTRKQSEVQAEVQAATEAMASIDISHHLANEGRYAEAHEATLAKRT